MAHFAQLDENNIVVYVTPVDNEILTDENGIEHDHLAIEHLQNTVPIPDTHVWKKTSYNNNFRGRYAGIGFRYDEELDAFIRPQPYPSWSFNSETTDWDPPTPKPPENENVYWEWDENTKTWIDLYDGQGYKPANPDNFVWNPETNKYESIII